MNGDNAKPRIPCDAAASFGCSCSPQQAAPGTATPEPGRPAARESVTLTRPKRQD